MKNYFVSIVILINFLFAQDIINPIPTSIAYDKAKSKLGKKIFMDTSLSKDGTISCNSCHDLKNFGVDHKEVSTGVENKLGRVNSPSVFNSVFNFVQFWDGRAKDLVEQAKGPFFNPVEMGLTPEILIEKVSANKDYVKEFDELFGELSVDTIALALAEFEKTLITPHSPFDKWLRGDENAISVQAKRGFESFKANGCISCHQGQNIGGNMYQKIGIFEVYPNEESSLGRFEQTKKQEDRLVFKVPSLRNVAKTPPYYHDGSIPSLDACIQFMAYYQLGKFLEKDVVEDIVAFLESLTGEYNEAN